MLGGSLTTSIKKLMFINEKNNDSFTTKGKPSNSCYSWNLRYVDVWCAPIDPFGQRIEAATGGKNHSPIFLRKESFHSSAFRLTRRSLASYPGPSHILIKHGCERSAWWTLVRIPAKFLVMIIITWGDIPNSWMCVHWVNIKFSVQLVWLIMDNKNHVVYM